MVYIQLRMPIKEILIAAGFYSTQETAVFAHQGTRLLYYGAGNEA